MCALHHTTGRTFNANQLLYLRYRGTWVVQSHHIYLGTVWYP